MKTLHFVLLFFFFQTSILYAQNTNLAWAKHFGGVGHDEGSSIAIDGNGNIYTTGLFSNTVDFDPGPGVFYLTPAGVQDIFVTKFDESGNFIWAKQFGRNLIQTPSSIVVDANGNVYISFLDWDKLFIFKLNSLGGYVWTKQIEGFRPSGPHDGQKLAIDVAGNLYLTGKFVSTIDFNPDPDTFNLISFGNSDIFVLKLNSSGNFIWAKQMGSTDNDEGLSIAVDANGNVFTTGYFTGACDFDPGSGIFILNSQPTAHDIFISKLNASGEFLWARSAGGNFPDEGSGICVDKNNNVIVTGSFYASITFGNITLTTLGPVLSPFIVKYDSFGNIIWAKNGITSMAVSSNSSICSDNYNNVYITGGFFYNITFGSIILNSVGQTHDIFVTKLDPFGNFVWAKQMGGLGVDGGKAIIVDNTGNIYTTGSFTNTADFDPGTAIYNLTSAGGPDCYILKLSQLLANIKLNQPISFSGGLSTLVTGSTYNLEFGLKNSGNTSWQGDIYWQLNNGTYRIINSNITIAASNYSLFSTTFTPLTSEVGLLPVAIFSKVSGSSEFELIGTINGTKNPINISIKLPGTDVEKPLPFIRLDKSLYLPSEVVRITGGNFVAAEVVSVAADITLPSVLPTLTVQTDGRISGTFTIPATAKESKIKVKVLDVAGNNPAWQALIKQSETATLQITKPSKLNSTIVVEEDGSATLAFTDKLLPKYPIAKINNTRRSYKYQIGYKLSGSNTVINLIYTTLKDGINFSTINDKIQVPLPLSQFPIGNKNIIFVITDVYDNLRVAESPEITIQTIASTITISKKWDASFTPSLSADPIGIAADGAARMYLVVEKNTPTGSPISNVSVTLTSPDGVSDPSWLGKVKFANIQNNNAYSEEANGITSITAQSNTALNQNWFWYVAPDDFMRNGMPYSNESEREVIANFTINFADGSNTTKTHKITIVRPPVMLVHGLGGGAESTWSNFPLKSSSIFKQILAVDMLPNEYYLSNAYILLGLDPTKPLSSFGYQLKKMRQKGFACTQVDYLCHSMGGAMFRSVMDNFPNRYYQSNFPNKTYGKGFVNKFITLDTPHNGSPWADLITAIAPLLPKKARIPLSALTAYSELSDNFTTGINAFIKPTDETVGNKIQKFEATHAVKNLQVIAANDGVDFKELVGIPSHLIAGDVVRGSQAIPDMEGTFLDIENYNKYFKLFYHVCDYIADGKRSGNEPAWLNDFMNYVQITEPEVFRSVKTELEKAKMVTKLIEMFCLFTFRYANIFVDGDIIVPLTSQIAGMNSGNGYTILNDKLIDFSKFHRNITEDNSANDKVKILLNEAVSSTFFITSIPAKMRTTANLSLVDISNNKNLPKNTQTAIQRPFVESFDKTKIEIISPTSLSNLKVGQNFPVRVQVKDFVNLQRVELSFQSNSYGDTLQNQYYNFYPTFETNLLGKQLLIATATYIKNDTVFFKMDTLSVNAITDETVEVFNVTPKYNNIGLDEKFKPTYDVGYGKFVSSYVDFSKLNISISNTTSLGYDNINHIFRGLQKGESQVIFTYEGKIDTIYVAVADGGSPYTATITTGEVNSSTILCPGDPIQLSYTSTGTFGIGNEFLIQVSDINGDNFQTLETTQRSPLSAYLPKNMNIGSTYKVRVVSTENPIIGSVSSSLLTIKESPPAPNITSPIIFRGQKTTLVASNCSGTVNWHSSYNDGTLLSVGYSYTTPILNANISYFADCILNGCISSIRSESLITVLPNPCPQSQVLTGQYIAGHIQIFQSSETLLNSAIVRNGAEITNYAGKTITLNPGFKVETGGVFKAYIGECQH